MSTMAIVDYNSCTDCNYSGGGYTIKLMKLKLQGPLNCTGPFQGLGTSSKQTFTFVPNFVLFFFKKVPKIEQASGPAKPVSTPATIVVKDQLFLAL